LKKTATEIFSLLCEAYGKNTLSRGRVFECQKRFSEVRKEGRMWKMANELAIQ